MPSLTYPEKVVNVNVLISGNLIGSRAIDSTLYTNTSNRPILCLGAVIVSTGAAEAANCRGDVETAVGSGIYNPCTLSGQDSCAVNIRHNFMFIVPPGRRYRLVPYKTGGAAVTLTSFFEVML